MAEIEISEADVAAAKEYFRHIGSIDECRVGPSHIKELAEIIAEVRTAATTVERERIAPLLRDCFNEISVYQDGIEMLDEPQAWGELEGLKSVLSDELGGKVVEAECFYVQNVERGYVGNNPQFWAKGGNGYTSYIDNAERFTEADALALLREDSRKWRVWSSKDVAGCIYRTVESQQLNRLKPVPQPNEARDE